jgi:hypothetical protein
MLPRACEWNELEVLMLEYNSSFLSMRWLGIARFHSHFVHRSCFVLFVVGTCIWSCVIRLGSEILPWEQEIARDECLGVLHHNCPFHGLVLFMGYLVLASKKLHPILDIWAYKKYFSHPKGWFTSYFPDP